MEPTAGRWARFVGVIPDAGQPGGVAPVWGSAETLHLAAQAKLPDGQRSDPLLATFNVHPEPGQPTALACRQHDGQPCGDTFRYWPGYLAGTMLYDSYRLVDGHGNTTFGYTDTHATQPGEGIGVDFKPQIGTYGSPAAYAVGVTWPGGASRPSGQKSACLSVTYPADPGGDWPAGAVSRAITLDFQGGETRMLIAKQNYDARFAADDGAMPMTVSPGAGEGGLPTSPAGDTPRLVLLAVRGTQVPWAIVGGGDEPSLEPFKVYRSQLGTWQKVQASPGSQDVVLDTQPGGTFRLSLVDGSFNVVPETAFRVHRCPRGEHLTAESPPPEPCTLGAVDSEGQTGILPSLELNPAGGARGYLGIELTKAPVNPGTYYILVESTGATPYRIRQGADLVRRAGQESEYLGAYALCTVAGVEILDENFGRPEAIPVNAPTLAYVRVVSASQAQSEQVLLSSQTEDGLSITNDVPLNVLRVGKAGVFVGPFALAPEGSEPQGNKRLPRISEPVPSGPVVPTRVGISTILATSTEGSGSRSASTKGTLRVRFMVRDQACVHTDDRCLTPSPDPQDPTRVGSVQETFIDPANNYSETVRLLIEALDTEGHTVTTSPKLKISETPNLTYHEDLRSSTTIDPDPDAIRRLFYDGWLGSSDIDEGKLDGSKVKLSNGRRIIRLASVASARHDPLASVTGEHHMLPWPYIGTLVLEGDKPGTFDPVTIDIEQWVDEQSYERRRTNQGAAWAPLASGQTGNGVIDWLEMKAWDALCALSPPPQGGEDTLRAVSGQVSSPLLWSGCESAKACDAYVMGGSDPGIVWWYPRNPTLRATGWRLVGSTRPVETGKMYFGLFLKIPANALASWTIAHESRHAWQFKLVQAQYNPSPLVDIDFDGLPAEPPVGSPELRDAPYGTCPTENPEFNSTGDAVGKNDGLPVQGSTWFWRQSAIERNAVRFESATMSNASPSCSDALLQVWKAGIFARGSVDSTHVADLGSFTKRFPGAMIRVDRAPVGMPCDCSQEGEPWSFQQFTHTDWGGEFSFHPQGQVGRYRFTVLRPLECAGQNSVCGCVEFE